MRSKFGTGWVVGGKCDQIKKPEVNFSELASIWRIARHVKREMVNPIRVNNMVRLPKVPVDIDVEDLGVKLPPLCIKCKGCTDCS